MAVCSIEVTAPIDQVFDVLLDPNAYPEWVIGAHKIRWIDRDWPTPGSAFHHEAGPWFARHRDKTEMVRSEPGRWIELRAHTRPTGSASVRLTLEAKAERTIVTLDERTVGGLIARVWNPLLERMLKARNEESLKRLARYIESGARQ